MRGQSLLNKPVVWLLLLSTGVDSWQLVSVHLSENAAERAERREQRRRKCAPHRLLVEAVEGQELFAV